VSSWFFGKELAMALAMNVSIARVGSAFNDLSEPQMYEATGSIDFGLWVGFVLCVISALCGVGLVIMDKRRDVKMGIKGKK